MRHCPILQGEQDLHSHEATVLKPVQTQVPSRGGLRTMKGGGMGEAAQGKSLEKGEGQAGRGGESQANTD